LSIILSVLLSTMSVQLQLGKPAPNFKAMGVANNKFQEIRLDDFKGRYLVLFFYPRDFTFVCPTEIVAFSDRIEEFNKLNCSVVACSTDSEYSHLAWIRTPRKHGGLGEMKIPILADPTHKISSDYSVFDAEKGLAYRGLFIIDHNGILRQIIVNDLPVGRNVDEVLRLIQALRHADEFGEVCPANWKPGGLTIRPDKSEEYFSKAG
ncbi:Peroxiredoxin-2, partial [Trichinella spiralis]